ncbi:MAG: RIP metalloprotease RseP [Planctomycetota bacterium]
MPSQIAPILLAAAGISFLIFIHEIGHFVAARIFGVRVEVFSLGFGPRLLGWRRGDTDYRLSLVPLGGYVKMAGEYGEAGEPRPLAPDDLNAKPAWQRAIIFSGGVLVNFAFAFVAFPLAFSMGVPFTAPVIGSVTPGGAAWLAGLQPGDEILTINGNRLYQFSDIALEVALGDPDACTMTLLRAGREETVTLRPQRNEAEGRFEAGLGPAESEHIVVTAKGPAEAAGLRTGDRLLTLGGETLGDGGSSVSEAFQRTAQSAQPLDVTYEREGVSAAARILPLVTERADSSRLGVMPLGTRIAGLRGSAAALGAPLQPNDTLVAINGQPVFNADEVRAALQSAPPGAALSLRRDDQALDVALTPPLRDALLAGDVALDLALHTTVVRITPDGALAAAGLRSGDRILALGTEPIADYAGLQKAAQGGVREVAVRYLSAADGQVHTVVATTRPELEPDYGIGLQLRQVVHRERLGGVLQAGWDTTLNALRTTWLTLVRLFTGDVAASNLGGIVQISVLTYHFADTGVAYLLFFLALLSVNLGIINVLPIPVLDGGQLMFLLFEKIKGGRLSDRFMNSMQMAGLVAILALVVYVTFNDIRRLVG